MEILPLRRDLAVYLTKRNLEKFFSKQQRFFEQNPFYPSLRTELLEPKHLRFWSFRITKGYRAIFIFRSDRTAEIVDINNHYQ